MNEEQKEKWYNSFTREQLIERCEYLQRSCERKENSIMELEIENADLESIIKEVREYIEYQLENLDFEEDTKAKMLGAMVLVLLDKENKNEIKN